MKIKVKDRIKLSDGQVMTLGEALDLGLLILKEVDNYPHKKPRHIAREKGGDLFWEVGETLYKSRCGIKVAIGSSSDCD